MAAARGTPGVTGLGDLDLNTSGVELGEVVTTELGEDGAHGFADPWARFAAQLDWDELRVASSAAELEPALLPAATEHAAEARPPMRSDAAPSAVPAPRTPPGPERSAYVAARAAVAAADPRLLRAAPPARPTDPGSVELPTEPALRTQPASGPRAQWHARAQELGLYSVFIAAADDFSGAAFPALRPALATAPPITAAATATTDPAISPSADIQPPPLAPATSDPSLPPESTTPPPDPASTRLLGTSRSGGLLRSLQRSAAPPPAQDPAALALGTPPPPLPQSVGNLFAAEAVQVVKE